MIDKDLLQILACPESHQSLAEAETSLLAKINERIASGQAKNRAGGNVTEKLEGGLVRQDGKLVYPIREGIPVLLIDEGIPI